MSQATMYFFFLVASAQIDGFSDYDGDGKTDLLSIGADGGGFGEPRKVAGHKAWAGVAAPG